ncbi:hypothetical protein C483_15007 [Natrialba hulunbeirensis JCM 10989]|uniref:HTH marR-type domain-containing protein n=1 Tax=Natrialba hulunbeirensis JCM 10989 TaxID=1227493 RepID=L9ZTZ1_9EURY|nr:MarR family transcriptional regulator [Natrialba hulunbeirensis]ELY88658.1 hypothetical protein C483_15007 [Natrialba hulunbeirensis JCM 10989]
MVRVPEEFRDEFNEKGETFFEIAELLYAHPGRQFTQNELAEKMERSTTTISNHTREMVDEGWLNRQKDQTTFAWNSDVHNPASTEGITAARRFYVDLLNLLKEHSKTTPGAFAILGFAMILTAVVVFAVFVGFSLRFTQDSSVSPAVYIVIAVSSFLTGVIMTLLSPMQAMINRFVGRLISTNIFQSKE